MAKKKSTKKKKNTKSSAQKRQPLEAANDDTVVPNVAVGVTATQDGVEATPMGFPPPVGVNYYAISPEENFTSAHQMTRLTFTNIFEVNTATAFEELFSDSDKKGAIPDQRWGAVLLDKILDAASEGLMNAAIQKSLKQIEAVDGLEIYSENYKTAAKVGCVQEKQLWNLMNIAYAEQHNHEKQVNGLPITLESLPDFAVWTKSNTVMLMGEGKNQEKYDFDACLRQCASYMLAHLFRWIVWKSKAVKAVYGVAFCGPKCNGFQRASVAYKMALLKLSLPLHVGGKLQLTQFIITKGAVEEHHKLDLLRRFAYRVCAVGAANAPDIAIGRNCPARMLLPREILLLQPEERAGIWSMVENGTSFLVIKLESQDGFELFSNILGLRKARRDYFVDTFKASGVAFPCFLKVKNYLGSHEPQLRHFIDVEPAGTLASDLTDAYKIKPVYLGNHAMCILMANMGESIGACATDSRLDASKFCGMYRELMQRTVTLEEELGLNHGDIHLGNLVYGDDRLRLIDFDEARLDKVTERKPVTEPQRRVHVIGLRMTPIDFTKNQLVNLFCECWNQYFRPNKDDIYGQFVDDYCQLFSEGQSPDADKVSKLYEQLIELLGGRG